jgi:hypothetical protein
MVDTNVTFHKYDNIGRAAFNVISDPAFSMLNGLSIPSGICLYKNKRDERLFPVDSKEMFSDTLSTNCISEGVYNKLFNLACYSQPKKTAKMRNLKKSSSHLRRKASYKKKITK